MQDSFLRLTSEKIALFLFGIFFVAILIVVAIAIPYPTEAQWRIFNVVLALVAAAIGAILPGALHLQFTPWLKAGGALGVFALVYLVKPATLVALDPLKPLTPPPAIELAKPVIDHWLQLLDNGKYDEAYMYTHDAFKTRYQKADFIRLGQSVRTPLGSVVYRREVGQDSSNTPFGDRGHVRVYSFITHFNNEPEALEEYVSVFAKDLDSGWLPFGYKINVQRAITTNKLIKETTELTTDIN